MIIAHAMRLTGLELNNDELDLMNALTSFEDADQVAEWAKDGIKQTLQSVLVTGKSNHDLAPKAKVTRAEIAIMIQKLLVKSKFM